MTSLQVEMMRHFKYNPKLPLCPSLVDWQVLSELLRLNFIKEVRIGHYTITELGKDAYLRQITAGNSIYIPFSGTRKTKFPRPLRTKVVIRAFDTKEDFSLSKKFTWTMAELEKKEK